METVQMNTRIDGDVKRAGDAVLHRFGYTASGAVQALWEYLSQGLLPSFMPVKKDDSRRERLRTLIDEGAGMAVRMMEEQCGAKFDFSDTTWEDDEELRFRAYRERGLIR